MRQDCLEWNVSLGGDPSTLPGPEYRLRIRYLSINNVYQLDVH